MNVGKCPLAPGIVVLAIVAAFGTAPPAAGATAASAAYRIVDLGGPVGGSAANGITADGYAAGYALVGPSQPHAVLFSDGEVRDLGTLGGDASLANAVDASGRVAGWARLADATRHAFLYENGTMLDLGTLGGTYSMAFALNNSGTVVGASEVPDARVELPFVWTAATGMIALPIPDGAGGEALAVNDAGEVVGYTIDHGVISGFRSDGVTFQRLGDLDRPGSKAYGISANGIAAGYAFAGEGAPHFHATIWRGTAVQDLGALPGGHSVAYGVNSAGIAVGFSYTAASVMVATRFVNGIIVDLNTVSSGPGWQLAMATAITDEGVISGVGTLDGVGRAFALVPVGLHHGPWGTPAPVTEVVLGAWPSPMRDAGTLALDLPSAERGRIALYDVTGRRVGELASGAFAAGRSLVPIGRDALARAGAGVFYARFEGERSRAGRRIVIVR